MSAKARRFADARRRPLGDDYLFGAVYSGPHKILRLILIFGPGWYASRLMEIRLRLDHQPLDAADKCCKATRRPT